LTAEGFTLTGNVDPHGFVPAPGSPLVVGTRYTFEISYYPLAADSDTVIGSCPEHTINVAYLRCHHFSGLGGEGATVLSGTAAQTVMSPQPAAFELLPSVRALATQRWLRPSATPSLYVRLVAFNANGETFGPEQRVTALRPKAQTTATTGKATFTKSAPANCGAGVTLTGRANFSVGAAWAMFEYGPTPSFGSFAQASPSVRGPSGEFRATTSKTEPLHQELYLPGGSCRGGPGEITANEKVYYRLVSDDGFGKGPSYGAVHTVQG
jgi:hypothetical protein